MVTGTHPIVRASFIPWTARFEGRVACMYLDAKGIVTAAMGIALPTAADAHMLPWDSPASVVDADWQTVHGHQELAGVGGGQPVWLRLTRARLPFSSLDALTLARFDRNDPLLAARWPCWPQFPADAQLVAHSMSYAMGAKRLDEFPRFCAAMETFDFKLAADECHMNETGNAPLHPRNIADRNGLLSAATVMAEGEPRDALYVAW
jgi:hypothetical protein